MRTEPPDTRIGTPRRRSVVYFSPPEAGLIADALRNTALEIGCIADAAAHLLRAQAREWEGRRSGRFQQDFSTLSAQMRSLEAFLQSQAGCIRDIRISREEWTSGF